MCSYNTIDKSLREILCDRKLLPSFVEYIYSVHAQELLEFYLEIEIFRNIANPLDCAKEAKRIVNVYLRANTSHEVSVSDEIRTQIVRAMKYSIWDTSVFDDAQSSVVESMNYDVLRTFRSSLKKDDCEVPDWTPLKGRIVHRNTYPYPLRKITELVKSINEVEKTKNSILENSRVMILLRKLHLNCKQW